MKEQQPPIPLDYRNRKLPNRPSGSGWSTAAKFFAGFVSGCLISGVVWPLGWHYITEGQGGWLGYAVPVVKISAAIAFLSTRDWRAAGAGVLVSLAVGFMIFFGTCAANFKV
jgi:hypothetical protein